VSFIKDLPILFTMVAKSVTGDTHQERLESFYKGQASGYDDFRKRLLHGREGMYRNVPCPKGGTWIDMGGGTGANLEFIGERIHDVGKIYIVDLSTSLLKVAEERIKANGWKNVEAVEADATKFIPPEEKVDTVTFSYSLTMIPDWFAAIDHAETLLKDDGHIGIVDFFVSRKYPSERNKKHAWLRRHFWPVWFATDNVFLSPDHLPYLQNKFEQIKAAQKLGCVPYTFSKAPYYQFVGGKKTS